MNLQFEIESERRPVASNALEHVDVDLREAQRIAVVSLRIEETRQEAAPIAPAMAFGGEQRMDDREPCERTRFYPLHDEP